MRSRTAVLLASLMAALTPGLNDAQTSTLSVSMSCQAGQDVCEAVATGGTGGYTWDWKSVAASVDNGDSSIAYLDCAFNDYIKVIVTVTDGSNATASASRIYTCAN